jgi:hypothetical protein
MVVYGKWGDIDVRWMKKKISKQCDDSGGWETV